jgi:hypothetical protein
VCRTTGTGNSIIGGSKGLGGNGNEDGFLSEKGRPSDRERIR